MAKNWLARGAWPILGCACLAGISLGLACSNSARTHRAEGIYIVSQTTLNPDKLPYKKGDLILGGVSSPINLEAKSEGDRIKFILKAHGEVAEEEVYRRSASEYALVDAAGTSFEPPIPLLKYPMNAGEKWQWKGQMIYPSIPRDSTASIETAEKVINLRAGQYSTIYVHVTLLVPSGGPEPAKRELEFWFDREGSGLIKRAFGYGSTREPASGSE